METLTELVAKITTDAAGLKSGLSDAEKQTEASSKKMQDSLKKVGTIMAASGAAITAALGLMGKAALDEEINIKRLATTINNSGTAYDSVKDSMEALISTTQRKTGVADNEQRDILNRLILVTNDYGKAMELLPTVLDLAAAGEMDATTAATYLGKAYLELEEGAEEVSVRFGQASLQFKNMADIQNRVRGSAENLANPLSVLKASMGDVAETIGANLLPIIKPLIDQIVTIAIKVQEWAKEHPELAKVITIVAAGLGILLTVIGGLILILPTIIAGVAAFGVVFHAALGPIGLISLAIMGLIAIGILLWKNWDKVSAFFGNVWATMKAAVLTGVGAMLGYLEKFLGWIPGIGDKIKSARDAIANMIDKDRIAKDIKDTQKNLEELTKTVTEEFDKQASEIQASYDKQRSEAKKTYDAAIDAINKEYGIAESTTKNKIELAKEATQRAKDNYGKEKDAAKDRYDFEMQRIQDIYDERLSLLEEETDSTIDALQDQIDAIDRQTDAEELALEREEEQKKLATLEGAEYDKYAAEIARKELLRTRDAQKDALRQQIEDAREYAQNQKDRIQDEEDAALESLKTKYEAELANYTALAEAADTDLANELVRIETDRLVSLDAEKQKLDTTLARLDESEKADIEFFAKQLAATNQQIQDINVAYNGLIKRYDIEIVTHHRDESSSGGGSSNPSSSSSSPPYAGEFATGGTVPGVMGQPYLATVHGGETIIPANESMGNVVVNFTQPVFFDREDTMNRFVDMISKGIDRKYRLGGRSLA
jgi:hypothetical protein